MSADRQIQVGLAGLGRSGWDIHANLLRRLPEQYRIVAAFDNDPRRRQEAERCGWQAHTDYTDLINDRRVELVVVAVPSHLHVDFSLAALSAGKHVVCEKPMATSVPDGNRLLAAANDSAAVMTVFHNRRYDPDFRKILEVTSSGVLGRIVAVRLTATKFSRRWDWQTLNSYGGGELNNIGSHLLDLALQFSGEEILEVFCHRERTLTLGDAEDHVKILIQSSNAPTIDIEISSACAYPFPKWNILGTLGGLTGSDDELRWKFTDPSRLPPRVLEESSSANRTYNSDELDWHEERWTSDVAFPACHVGFYEDLYRTIREGAPLVITSRSAQRVIEMIEVCRKLSPL